jgi:hypothetical protein
MGQPTTILENEYGILMYYPDLKIVHHVFRKPIGGKAFQEILNGGLDVFRQKGAYKWLSDDRNNSVFAPEDAAWVFDVWVPQVMQTGWKYWALLVPDTTKARQDMAQFINGFYEQGVRVMLFATTEEALAWLSAQP